MNVLAADENRSQPGKTDEGIPRRLGDENRTKLVDHNEILA